MTADRTNPLPVENSADDITEPVELKSDVGSERNAGPGADADAESSVDADSALRGADERRRRVVLGSAGVLLVAVLGAAAWIAVGPEDTPPPKPDIPLDAWAPYWTLDDSLGDAALRLPSMREISPFWFEVADADTIVVSEFADPDRTAEFLDIARSAGVAVVPSIVDALAPREMAAILADPQMRSRHVDAVVEFAAGGDFDGVDLDYEEFAFSDGRETWADTRPDWVAFIEELGAALRSDGRTLTVSIPPIYDTERTDDSGFWVYDHGAIAPHVDFIRVMAYDFSVGEPGPIAPLDFVERSIDGVVAATGDPDKVVLGLAAYGRNWPVGITGECPADAEIPERTTVTARSVDDLIELRRAVPVHDPDTGESSFAYDLEITDGDTTCVQRRQVHYVDADGVRARMDLAREKRLAGVSLWAFGFDDEAVWAEILPIVSS